MDVGKGLIAISPAQALLPRGTAANDRGPERCSGPAQAKSIGKRKRGCSAEVGGWEWLGGGRTPARAPSWSCALRARARPVLALLALAFVGLQDGAQRVVPRAQGRADVRGEARAVQSVPRQRPRNAHDIHAAIPLRPEGTLRHVRWAWTPLRSCQSPSTLSA